MCGIAEDDARFLPLIRERNGAYLCVPALDRLPAGLDLAAFDLVLFCGVDYVIPERLAHEFGHDTVFCFAGLHDMALYQTLYEFAYTRILDHGFGLFSHSSRIMPWTYQEPAGLR